MTERAREGRGEASVSCAEWKIISVKQRDEKDALRLEKRWAPASHQVSGLLVWKLSVTFISCSLSCSLSRSPVQLYMHGQINSGASRFYKKKQHKGLLNAGTERRKQEKLVAEKLQSTLLLDAALPAFNWQCAHTNTRTQLCNCVSQWLELRIKKETRDTVDRYKARANEGE